MKCCYRDFVDNHSIISLEVKEIEIMAMYQGSNRYSKQIQTSLKPTHYIPKFKVKYRGNIYQKACPQYFSHFYFD